MSPTDALPLSGLDADLILVGGGLANGLVAWRLLDLQPQLRVLMVESSPGVGGNHTWSWHADDLDEAQQAWMAPFAHHQWPGYSVAFPGFVRHLDSRYLTLPSSVFSQLLTTRLPPESLLLGAAATALTPTTVTLADGRTLRGRAVLDGRGVRASRHLQLGYQKFVGLEVELAEPHGLDQPLLMDACVDQVDGYRFVYLLPFTPTSLLVEDTVYADGGEMSPERLKRQISDYLDARGWRVRQVLREEQGALPIVLGGDHDAYWHEAAGVARSGLAAGLFHPTTGYSLPDAVRLADKIARAPQLGAEALFRLVRDHAQACWRRQAFFRLLNRMLFLAATPAERRAVMARFYTLPAPLIARFYAGRPTTVDKLRMLTGKPPVPLWAAARAALSLHPQMRKNFP